MRRATIPSLTNAASELVKRCSRELRAITHRIYPPLLDHLGLEPAVRFHVDGFIERAKVKVELDIQPNIGCLDRNLEIVLFRVVEGALASIHQRYEAKNARVKIGASSNGLSRSQGYPRYSHCLTNSERYRMRQPNHSHQRRLCGSTFYKQGDYSRSNPCRAKWLYGHCAAESCGRAG